jgi:DNA-binding PadR family transcriptional regulator
MGERKTDLPRGTLDLRRITQITRGAFQVSFGSLFPSLHRLTSSGRAQLKVEERDWNRVVKAMTVTVQWEA